MMKHRLSEMADLEVRQSSIFGRKMVNLILENHADKKRGSDL